MKVKGIVNSVINEHDTWERDTEEMTGSFTSDTVPGRVSVGRVVEMTALYGKVDGACEILLSLLFLVLVTHVRENLAPNVASYK